MMKVESRNLKTYPAAGAAMVDRAAFAGAIMADKGSQSNHALSESARWGLHKMDQMQPDNGS
jgi:hypothetical protein